MPGDDKRLALARVYAQAFFQVAEESGVAETLLAELAEVGRLIEQRPDLAESLLSPIADSARRGEALERVFRERASDLFADVLQVLNARGRLELLPAVARAYREAYQRARRVLDVHVATAVPLSDAQRGRLKELTRRLTGEEAVLVERVEPDLLGGMVLRVHDRKFDSSLSNLLARLSAELLDRASQEIILARVAVT